MQALLADEGARWDLIRTELMEIRDAYADKRRTSISEEVVELEYDAEAYIIDEKTWVMVTREGWIKRQKSYSDLSAIRVKENDAIGWVLPGRTRQTVILFSNLGRAYTLRIDDVIATTGHGEPIQARFDFEDGERIVGAITDDDRILVKSTIEPAQTSLVPEENEAAEEVVQFVAMTRQGQCMRFDLSDYQEPSTVKGRRFMRLGTGDEIMNVEMSDGTENVAIASLNGRGLLFPVADISYFKGAAKGVKAMSLEKKDELLDFTLCRNPLDGLEVETNRGAKIIIRATKAKFEPKTRGNKGRWIIRRGHLIRSHRPPVEFSLSADDDGALDGDGQLDDDHLDDTADSVDTSQEE